MNKNIDYALTGIVLFILGLLFSVIKLHTNTSLFSLLNLLLIAVFVFSSFAVQHIYKYFTEKAPITTAKAILYTYLLIAGYVLLSVATVQVPKHPTLNIIMGVLGLVGIVLVMLFQHDTTGLSNSEQALLSTISMLLIVVGGFASVTNTLPWQAGIILAILGAIGAGLKEALGSLPPATTKVKS